MRADWFDVVNDEPHEFDTPPSFGALFDAALRRRARRARQAAERERVARIAAALRSVTS